MDPIVIELLEEILQQFGDELKREIIRRIVKKSFESLRKKKENQKGR